MWLGTIYWLINAVLLPLFCLPIFSLVYIYTHTHTHAVENKSIDFVKSNSHFTFCLQSKWSEHSSSRNSKKCEFDWIIPMKSLGCPSNNLFLQKQNIYVYLFCLAFSITSWYYTFYPVFTVSVIYFLCERLRQDSLLASSPIFGGIWLHPLI